MSTFQLADRTLESMLQKVLREHYEELHGLTKEKTCPLTFDLLMVHADLDGNGEPVGHPLKHQGRTAAAVIKAVPKADRCLGRADVEIRFDGDYWEKLDAPKREALLDHELYHLVLVREDGLPKRDDLGRFRFKMREHDFDFGWFVEIAKRRGLDSGEVQQANRMVSQHGQILFGFAEMPAPELPGIHEDKIRVMPAPAPSEATSTAAAPAGRWMIWEQMDAELQEVANAQFEGALDRGAQFFVTAAGDITDTRAIEEAPAAPPAAEVEAKPKTTRRKAAQRK